MSGMKADRWTPKQIDILCREFPYRQTSEVAKMIGRPQRATELKAHRLGLKKKSYGIEWTPQMLKILKDFFPIMFNKPLAMWLRVSQRTMSRKAAELGLKKEEGFMERRRDDINALLSEALKKAPDTNGTRFKKGMHASRDTEFKKGRKLSPEVEERRVAAYKKSLQKKKQSKTRLY